MRKILIILFLVIGNNVAVANDNAQLDKAQGYLTAILTNDYTGVLNYVDIKDYTSKPEQSLWLSIEAMHSSGVLTDSTKAQLLDDLAAQELTESDLKEITNKEYLSYMLLEMFKLQEGGYTNLESLRLSHISTQSKGDISHFIFETSGQIMIEGTPNLTKNVSDYRLVSIKNGKILIPSKVDFLTRQFVGVFTN